MEELEQFEGLEELERLGELDELGELGGLGKLGELEELGGPVVQIERGTTPDERTNTERKVPSPLSFTFY